MKKSWLVGMLAIALMLIASITKAEESGWIAITLPDPIDLTGTSHKNIGAAGHAGTVEGALAVLEAQKTKSAGERGTIIYGGNNNSLTLSQDDPIAGEGDWTGSGILLLGRNRVSGSAGALIPVLDIAAGTQITGIRVKATICGFQFDETTPTTEGTLAVGVGHVTATGGATVLNRSAAAEGTGGGGAGTDTSLIATISYDTAYTWAATDKILVSFTAPSVGTGNKYYYIRVDQLAYQTKVYSGSFTKKLAAGANDVWSADWDTAAEGLNVPDRNSFVVVSSDADDSLSIDCAAVAAKLETEGPGKITFSNGGEEGLHVDVLTAKTDTDVSGITASLGTVAIADGKTVTGRANSTQFTSLTGDGTFSFGASAAGVEYSYAFNASWTTGFKWTCGDLVFSTGGNGTGYPKNAPLTVSGRDARVVLRTNDDTTGYSGGTAPLTIENGATLLVEKRDTFNRPLVLTDGHVKFSGDNLGAGRSFDLFSESSITSSGASTIGADDSGRGGVIAIRRSDLTFTVADGTLSCYSQFGIQNGHGGSVIKSGAGTFEIYRAATHDLPVRVDAGTLCLIGDGKMTQGGLYTVAADAALELKDGAVLTNNIALAGNLKVTSGRGIVYGSISGEGTITVDGDGSVLGIGMVGYDNFTGQVVLRNKGAIVVPAGFETNHVIEADAESLLGLRLNREQMFNGYSLKPPTGVTVRFYSDTGTELETVSGNDGTVSYHPDINIWEKGVWRYAPKANEPVLILVSEDYTAPVQIPDGVTFGAVKIEGIGSVSFAGNKLTATSISLSTILNATEDATITLTADPETVALAPMKIGERATIAYTTAQTITLTQMTGEGTFSKFGTGAVSALAATNCSVSVVMNAGTFMFDQGTDFQNAYDLTIKNGAVLEISRAWAKVTSADNVFRLEGGSKLKFKNGNDKGGTVRASVIVSDSTDETPVTFEGSNNGNYTLLQGTISGVGTIRIVDVNDNLFTIAGMITDGADGKLKLEVATDRGVKLSNSANTYSGGTEIVEGGILMLAHPLALGTGPTTINGTLQLVDIALGTKVSGSGTITNTAANATVSFTGNGAIVPTYDSCLTVGGSGANVKFDVSSLLDAERRFDLFKVNSAADLPARLTGDNFIGGTFPKGWMLVPVKEGFGWAMAVRKFFFIVR